MLDEFFESLARRDRHPEVRVGRVGAEGAVSRDRSGVPVCSRIILSVIRRIGHRREVVHPLLLHILLLAVAFVALFAEEAGKAEFALPFGRRARRARPRVFLGVAQGLSGRAEIVVAPRRIEYHRFGSGHGVRGHVWSRGRAAERLAP